jgi:hypothetical protein
MTTKDRQRQLRQQIPYGNDNKKSKGKGNDKRRFPSGMTTRNDNGKSNDKSKRKRRFPSGMTTRRATTKAKADANADSLRE